MNLTWKSKELLTLELKTAFKECKEKSPVEVMQMIKVELVAEQVHLHPNLELGLAIDHQLLDPICHEQKCVHAFAI